MPTSEAAQIPYVCEAMRRLDPVSIIDVGCGYGKYGVLAREYCDRLKWIDAVDVRPPRYKVYDRFSETDIRTACFCTESYDLALLLDVIEHLEYDEGLRLLATLTRGARRVLVTTPLGFRRQEVEGMPHETHRSGWWPWSFKGFTVHRWAVFPGHHTRHLRLPRLWQMIAEIGS